MSMYLELKDKDIEGDVTTAGYEYNIKIESFKFVSSKDIQYGVDHVHKPTHLSNIVITLFVDKSAPSLLQASFQGTRFATAKFKFTRDLGSDVKTYMDYELSDAYIVEYSISSESDTEPKETITFAFSKITYSYVDIDMTGKPRDKQKVTFNRNMNRD